MNMVVLPRLGASSCYPFSVPVFAACVLTLAKMSSIFVAAAEKKPELVNPVAYDSSLKPNFYASFII